MPEINTEADERLSAQVSEVIAKYDLLCGKMNTAVDEKTARAETAANNAASALEELKNTLIAGDYVTNAHLQEELSTKQPAGDYATAAALSAEQSRVNTELAKKVATVSVNSPLLATKSGTTYTIKFDGEETAGFHNSIYRGKFLGNSVTDSQWAAISSGTFKDLFIGDYWEIGTNSKGGINRWRIAAFDYFYGTGYNNTQGPMNNFHHAVIVPDTFLAETNMNDARSDEANKHDATTGYAGSKMRGTHLPAVLSTYIEPAFGASHVKEIWILLCTGVNQSTGIPTTCAWLGGKCELMTQAMVYGHRPFTHGQGSADGTVLAVYNTKTQLPLFRFRLDSQASFETSNYWLQDAADAKRFTGAGILGNTGAFYADNIMGVRPYFCIA